MSSMREPARRQVVVAVLLALLGFAATTQIQTTRHDNTLSGQPRENLVQLLDSLSAAADRAQLQLNQLRRSRGTLLSSSRSAQAALAEGRKRLRELQLLAGTVSAVGPGITLTITDPAGAVSAAALLNGIEELRDAGAEAIEINSRVRVVASTAFTEPRGVVTVDGSALRAPYVIEAIGSPHTLSEAVRFPGGLADQISQLGGTVNVKAAGQVSVSSLHPVQPPEYAQPTGG
jgi:uncharacterized protein YlxW (UPF0749 family)